MPRQVVIRPPSMNRRQPLLSSRSSSGSASFAEVAGGTAAECAAICCCCPCGIVNLLLLAVYKLPAGICRRALRKKRRQRMIKNGRPRCACGCEETELQIHPMTLEMVMAAGMLEKSDVADREVMELEKEMWDRFYSTGFWRSPSQRDKDV